MIKEFIPNTIAKQLKELGFDLQVLFFWFPDNKREQQLQSLVEYIEEDTQQTYHLEYKKNYIGVNDKDVETLYKEGLFQLIIPAPLWQQAFEWLRKKYNYMYTIDDTEISCGNTVGYRFKYIIWKLVATGDDDFYIVDESFLGYYSYDEAQQACLLAILKDLKNTLWKN